jgi:hypothetical protein
LAIHAVETLPAAVLLEELIREQAADADCQKYAAFAGADSLFDFNDAGVLVRKSPLNGALQVVVLTVLQP